MKVYKVPGISLAVINDYQVEWAQGYGLKESGKPHPVTAETLFQTAGGLWTTAEDIARFVAELLSSRRGQSNQSVPFDMHGGFITRRKRIDHESDVFKR